MRWIFFTLLILLFPLASSISTNMLSNYQPAETMIIEIQGNIIEPITPQDILFKRAHVAVAVNYDVKRIESKYYLYAQVPNNQNNYTLFINDIATTVNGVPATVDYNQTFTVSGNISNYSINPGFVSSDRDFTLTLFSNLDNPTNININFPDERAVTLQPGTNNIQFLISSATPGLHLATVGKYTVPILITRAPNQNETQENYITIYPPSIKQTILSNRQTKYNFSIINNGLTTTSNLYFSFDQSLFDITPPIIGQIQPNKSQEFSLTLKRMSGFPILGNILVIKGNEVVSNLTINISFTVNESQVTNVSANNLYYCSELKGKFCPATETCSSQLVLSLDGSCCTGLCQQAEESSNSWIAYVSIILVLIILFFVYRSYKKNKFPKLNKPSPIDPLILRRQVR